MIASDNVDEEVLQKSGKWDIKIINRYMIIFGLHSTFFDILTFVVLYYLLSAGESTFQTGWFIVSVLTELVILFIIRTRRSFIKSLPEKKLFILSIVAILFTVAMPYLPYADSIGLIALPIRTLGLMLGIVLLYIITADLLKIWFFRKYKN